MVVKSTKLQWVGHVSQKGVGQDMYAEFWSGN